MRQVSIDLQSNYSNHLNPNPAAEMAQIGHMDREQEKKKMLLQAFAQLKEWCDFGKHPLGL